MLARVLAAVLAAVGLAVTGVSSPPASAETLQIIEPRRAVDVRVAAVQALVNVGDPIELRVEVRNPDEEPLQAGIVRLFLHLTQVEHLEELTVPVTHAVGLDAEELGSVEIPDLDPGTTYSVTHEISADEIPLNFSTEPGVYLVSAAHVEGDAALGPPFIVDPPPGAGEVDATTPLVWRSAAVDGTLRLSPIVPLVYPSDGDGPLEPDALGPALGDGSRADELVTAAESMGATLAVDPKIIATVRAFGGTAPGDARTLVDRVTSGRVDTFALQYADADPSVQANLGLDSLMRPAGLSFMTRWWTPEPAEAASEQSEPSEAESDGRENPSDPTEPDSTDPLDSTDPEDRTDPGDPADPSEPAGPSDPAQPEEPGEPEVQDEQGDPLPPAIDDLLEWEPSLPGFAWPSTGSVSTNTVEYLAGQGLDSIIVTGLEPRAAERPPVGLLGESTLYHSDDSLTRITSAILTAETDAEREHFTSMLAAVTALQRDVPGVGAGPGAILAFDRVTMARAPEPERVFELLMELPWVETVPLADSESVPAPVPEGSVPEDRLSALAQAVDGEAVVAEYARVLAEPELLVDYQRDRLLTHLSSGVRESAADFLELNEVYTETDRALRSGISIVDTENTRLVGSSSRIPVQVQNTLPFEAALTGTVAATSAALTVEEMGIDPTLVEAGSSATILVPVVARVSNGESGILVTLQDTHGGDDVASRRLEIIIQSDIEMIALGTLASLAILFVGFGTFRSIRRHRTSADPVRSTDQVQS